MKVYGCLCGVLFAIAGPALAHSPVCSCSNNDDGTVTCEGGYSNGASAAGVEMRVVDMRDRVLLRGEMDENSSYTFQKPDQEFHVIFDAGQNHIVNIYSGDIK